MTGARDSQTLPFDAQPTSMADYRIIDMKEVVFEG
jgi:hypothetical protein